MILLVLVFASNFVFTWVIPIASVCAYGCACVAGENQALVPLYTFGQIAHFRVASSLSIKARPGAQSFIWK